MWNHLPDPPQLPKIEAWHFSHTLEFIFCAELCKNIPTKFRESLSKCSAAHPKIALWHNISASYSPNLAGMFLHYSVLYKWSDDREGGGAARISIAFRKASSIIAALPSEERLNKSWEEEQPGVNSYLQTVSRCQITSFLSFQFKKIHEPAKNAFYLLLSRRKIRWIRTINPAILRHLLDFCVADEALGSAALHA